MTTPKIGKIPLAVGVQPRQAGKTVDLAVRIASDPRQVEQIVREHQNMVALCGELKSKGVKQRQEIARLTRDIAQLRSDKANLLFDLNKERKLTEILRAEIAGSGQGENKKTGA